MTAMLSAVSSVLMMFLQFPIPFLIPSFIEMDFSDLPALIASFGLGPLWGVLVVLIKNVVHLLVTTTGGVGELSNFLLSSIFVATAGAVYHFFRTRKGALIGATAGALAMALVSVLTNYYVMYPIYYNFMPEEAILGAYQALLPSVDSILKSLFVFNLPFTFAKGMLNTLLAFLIYKHISSFLKGTPRSRVPK
ncbi:MAG: ECF transporter S component [Clostridia bacterium]|nr:ECF transporter S component [Clostridia bacterium]